jgi:hypothetical protein
MLNSHENWELREWVTNQRCELEGHDRSNAPPFQGQGDEKAMNQGFEFLEILHDNYLHTFASMKFEKSCVSLKVSRKNWVLSGCSDRKEARSKFSPSFSPVWYKR